MKYFTTIMLLLTALSTTPSYVLAIVKTNTSIHSSIYFKSEKEVLKPKWIKVLEWLFPIFMLLGIILFFSSLSWKGYWTRENVIRPINFKLAIIALIIALIIGLILFSYRIINLIKKQK